MTNQQHPITPPPELIEKWHSTSPLDRSVTVATQAARWGADQELEACCDSLQELWAPSDWITSLRAKRRPRPPSLKAQALSELNLTADPDGAELSRTQVELIRRALEALPE